MRRRRRGATRFVIYHAPRSATPPPQQKQTRKGTERSFRRAEIRNGGFSQPIYSAGRLERMLNRKWRETKQQPSRAWSGNQISGCLVSLHFLCDILSIFGPSFGSFAVTFLIADELITPRYNFQFFVLGVRALGRLRRHTPRPERQRQLAHGGRWRRRRNEE